MSLRSNPDFAMYTKLSAFWNKLSILEDFWVARKAFFGVALLSAPFDSHA